MLLGDPHQKVSGGTKILADFKEKLNFVALQMVDIFKCHHQDFPDPLSLLQMKKGRGGNPIPRFIRQQEDSHEDHSSNHFTRSFHRICQLHETDNQVLTPRTAEEEKQIRPLTQSS